MTDTTLARTPPPRLRGLGDMSITAAELEQAVRVALPGRKRVVLLGGWQDERDAAERIRRAEVRNKSAAWREAHRERVRAYNQAWRAANREKVRAYNEAWKARDPEAYRAMRRAANQRHAAKRSNP